MPHAADSSTTTTSSSSSNSNVPPLHHPNFNRGWSRRRHHRNNNNNANNKTTTTIHPNELSVTHLRRIYSTLLEEMAPSVHNGGTPDGKHYRWKNSGTVTMMGDDAEGYEYSYTPDNSQKSWRLAKAVGGIGAAAKALDDSKNGSLGGGVGGGGIIGITGGDWATDGIRRYHTGGSILVIEPPHHHPHHQSQQHFSDD